MNTFTHDGITLIHGDCMEYMAGLPDGAFDLAVVDPPYGIFADADKSKSRFAWAKEGSGGTWASKYRGQAKKWDTAPGADYFDELNRVAKERIIFGANYFGYPFGNFVVWRKQTISEGFTMAMAELASVSIGGNAKVFEYRPQDSERFHPTQKPVALYRWLLTNYARPGDTILDTHLGSGSSAIAAWEMGYTFTGIEIDADYYRAAVERFKKRIMQPYLPGVVTPVKPTQLTII